jgi:uncharacterized protein (TIGR03083 family)
MDLNTDELLAIAFDAVTAKASDLPVGLESRILDAALGPARPPQHPGWTDPDRAGRPSLRAFITTASELATLLHQLAPDQWSRTTRIEGARVRDLVEHMVGVERYVLGCLGRRPTLEAPRREDHWPVSKQAAAGVADLSDGAVAALWWTEVMDLIAACGELGPDHEITYHHLAGTLHGMLVVRTFELWTHGDDIRQATGRPLDLLDETRLSLMSGELMRVLPLGLALSGCPQPGRTARLTLTGPGGGSYDVALDPASAPGAPEITVTTDVIGLCRWAANRLSIDDLHLSVEGDRSLLEPILVGATAFAAD